MNSSATAATRTFALPLHPLRRGAGVSTPHGRRPRVAPVPRPIPGRWTGSRLPTAALLLVGLLLMALFFSYFAASHHSHPAAVPSVPATPSPTTGWPTMLANNQRTAATAASGPTGHFATLWTFTAPAGLDNIIVSGNAAFVQGEDGTLYCLDRMTGHQRWAIDTGGPSGGNTHSYPAVDGTTVYAAGRRGDIFALNVATGATKWKIHLSDDSVEASILVQDGVVYTGTSRGLFVALDAATGAVKWRFNDGQDFVNTFPAYQNGVIYVGGPKSVRAINAATGTLVWEAHTDGQVRGVAVDGGVVYAPTGAGSVDALAAADGHQLWQQTFPNVGPALSVAVSGAMVVAGFDAGGIVGLDTKTGHIVWQTPSSGGTTTASKISIANGLVYAYFGPRKGILVLDAKTGQERGFGATEEVRMPPSIVDGVLYAGSGAGDIAYAFVSEGTATPPPARVATPTPAASPAAGWVAPVSVWTVSGGAQPFDKPGVLAIDPHGDLWVADAHGQFQTFDLDGTYLGTWGSPGAGPGQFNFAAHFGNYNGGVAFANDGSFYVADTGNQRVQKFDPSRHLVTTWGGQGSGVGQFLEPVSIAVDGQGRVYVDDDLRDDVQVFDSSGRFIRSFRVHGIFGLAPDAVHNGTVGLLAIDAAGDVYVTSGPRSSVLKFDANGKLLAEIGGLGNGNGGFAQPIGVAVDGAGNLYVTDFLGNRIEVFDPTGRFLGEWGSMGQAAGQLNGPAAIVVRGKFIYITEVGGNRIQKFELAAPLPLPNPSTPTPTR